MIKKILMVIFFLLGVNNVYALSASEEVSQIMEKIDSEYAININDGHSITTYMKSMFLQNYIKKELLNYDISIEDYMTFSISYIENNSYKATVVNRKECRNEYGYYDECDRAVSEGKIINLVENIFHSEDIHDIINTLDKKSELTNFSNYFDNIGNSNISKFNDISIFTTSGQMAKVENDYGIEYIDYTGMGSTIMSNDNLIKTGWGKMGMLIVKENSILFAGDIYLIYTETEFNYYYPALNANDYTNIEDYVEDALDEFPSKILISDYEIILQDDGKKYTLTDDGYEVKIRSLEDDAIWTICISGKLKETPNTDVLKGDMNGNGRIDLVDIIMLLRIYLGIN